MKIAEMLDTKNFVVRFSYDPAVVAQVRCLPQGRRWVPELHAWTCPASVDALKQLREWGFEIKPDVIKWEQEFFKPAKPSVRLISNIPGLKHPLYPFQAEGVGFIEDRGGRVLIGDEMGLGKSCQAIAWTMLHPEKKVAIVCPCSLKELWLNEIKKWTGTDKNAVVIQGNLEKRKQLYKEFQESPDIKYLVINYDILSTDMELIKNL